MLFIPNTPKVTLDGSANRPERVKINWNCNDFDTYDKMVVSISNAVQLINDNYVQKRWGNDLLEHLIQQPIIEVNLIIDLVDGKAVKFDIRYWGNKEEE